MNPILILFDGVADYEADADADTCQPIQGFSIAAATERLGFDSMKLGTQWKHPFPVVGVEENTIWTGTSYSKQLLL